MRVGLITPSISANEHDWCIPALRHLVRQLAHTCDVRVVALRYPFQAGSYPLFGARVTALGGGTRRKLANLQLWQATLSTIARLHREQPFDVLHVFWATESGALAALAGRLLGIPVVVNIAGGELAQLPDAGYGGQLVLSERIRIRIALSLADVVVAGSHWASRMATPHLAKHSSQANAADLPSIPAELEPIDGPCIRLPLGVDLQLFHPQPGQLSDSPPRLVHAASLVPVKDQATLLRALAIVKQQSIPFEAEIAGEGILDAQLRALAAELGLEQHLRFRGPLAHDDLPRFFHGAAAFVLSSLHESQCMAVLEAAACGVPTVGTAVGVVPELAPDAAIAVPLRDPAALAAGIIRILDRQTQQHMAGAAARRAEEWSLAACVARTQLVYQLAIAQHHTRR